MFANYGRSETSFVCAVGTNPAYYQAVKRRGFTVEQQTCFPRYLDENEFILMLEKEDDGTLTGNELTLFVLFCDESIIHFDVVTENPDAFWEKA